MSTYEVELEETAAGSVVASLAGEFDLTNAGELEERLNDAAPEDAALVIDLNRVVFIDSAALHVLFKVARRQGAGRVQLVVEPNAPVSRTLDIVGMRHAVPIVASLDDL